MTETEIRYLMETAMSYIMDNDLLEDFLEDRDIDMSTEMKEYLGIEEE